MHLPPFARGGTITPSAPAAFTRSPATESATSGGAAASEWCAQRTALVFGGAGWTGGWALVAGILILHPLARWSGQRRAGRTATNRRRVEGVAHAVSGLLWHLDE